MSLLRRDRRSALAGPRARGRDRDAGHQPGDRRSPAAIRRRRLLARSSSPGPATGSSSTSSTRPSMIYLSARRRGDRLPDEPVQHRRRGAVPRRVLRRRRLRRRSAACPARSTSSPPLVLAIVVGAAWAGIAGLLEVTRGVSEVISTIMLNAIAAILDRLPARPLRRARRQQRPAPRRCPRLQPGPRLVPPFAAPRRADLDAGLLAVAGRRRLLGAAEQDPLRLRPARHGRLARRRRSPAAST